MTEIARAIHEAGYAYVLTGVSRVRVYDSAKPGKARVLLDKNALLCATKYVELKGRSAAVVVSFDTENGRQSGYVLEKDLKAAVLSTETVIETIREDRIEIDVWQDRRRTRPLFQVAYKLCERGKNEEQTEVQGAGPANVATNEPGDELSGAPDESEGPEPTESEGNELTKEPTMEPSLMPSGNVDAEPTEVHPAGYRRCRWRRYDRYHHLRSHEHLPDAQGHGFGNQYMECAAGITVPTGNQAVAECAEPAAGAIPFLAVDTFDSTLPASGLLSCAYISTVSHVFLPVNHTTA